MPPSSSDHATPYGAPQPAGPPKGRKPVTVLRLQEMRANAEKIAMLTAYDATFAAVADAAGVDCILVGDSLGMVCQGLGSTVGVTLESMRYHLEIVTRGVRRVQGAALVLGDLPYGTYHESREQALRSAVVLMQAGAQMIKLEGGGWVADTTRFLVERGIPVCAHLGLTPQTVDALGGYRVQGRTEASAALMKRHAHELQDAGASLLVLEMVPAALTTEITAELRHCATIGIGAGDGAAGQVLVMHDMLGMNIGRMPKFVRNFMTAAPAAQASHGIQQAMRAYVQAVKDGSFPVNALHAW